nr:cysteine and histidine-rich domain-containing protein [Leptinotarsa decemlineata]
MLQCYNRGCGQKFDPENNKEDSCRHHPGEPVFHDAYKGWSCCKKKCIDFTEFLNIKGCTLSKHSNVKPPEPEKPAVKDIPDEEVVEIKPIIASCLKRPPLSSELIRIEPKLAPSLKQQLNTTGLKQEEKTAIESGEIAIGTICKNGGCGKVYSGPETNSTSCIHHPGVPIFHEGMKYWSCCQKKTTDFNTFLSQIGCEQGTHLWQKDSGDKKHVQCRWDFHQTGSHVILSIYAKQYCPTESVVKLNPIRIYARLVFPQQANAFFLLDFELKGIINVEASEVTMFGTKVEIKLKKAEPGSWLKLGDPIQQENLEGNKPTDIEKITPQVEAVDLDDL